MIGGHAMSERSKRIVSLGALILLACIAATNDDQGFADKFDVKRTNFVATGRNDYFVLEPGYQQVFEGRDKGKPARLVITVLNDTKTIDGVETRVVEERESLDGQLIEVSRNYFAIDKTSDDVYYFGEDVDIYRNGKVESHGGSWHSGENGAHYGLFMPATPKVGQKFYQEIAPKVAMDRVEVVSLNETVLVPAGRFEKCLKTDETTPLEPGDVEHKLYGLTVGLLQEDELKLVKHGPTSK
jgi:hypothetical protein